MQLPRRLRPIVLSMVYSMAHSMALLMALLAATAGAQTPPATQAGAPERVSSATSELATSAPVQAAPVQAAPVQAAPRPRLLVLVSIDQCRAEYVQRFLPLLPEGGFRRLLAEGAVFPDAAHLHTVTSTAPGHAAIATGCLPARAGIPENEFLQDGVHTYCVADPDATLVGSLPGLRPAGVSARRLERPTLGDLLKAHFGREALVVSFAWKDRAALLMGGHDSDGSYWIESENGSWVTTSALRPALPRWLVALNARGDLASASDSVWERTLDEQRATEFSGIDDAPGESFDPGTRPVFPHQMPHAEPASRGGSLRPLCRLLAGTPAADLEVLAAVREALAHEPLGRDDTPDLLCVGFSGLDYTGHDFGPRSQEVLEMFLALDRRLAELMALLDEDVGAGRWTLALTSDHGVGDLPEQSGSLRMTQEELRARLEAALQLVLGAPPALMPAVMPGDAGGAPPVESAGTIADATGADATGADAAGASADAAAPSRHWISALLKPSVWIDRDACLASGHSVAELADAVAYELSALPGIELAATRAELAAALADDGANPDLRALAADVHPTRSGDVLFLVTHGTLLARDVAADHGTHHPEDRDVPLIFYGAGIAPGIRPGPAAPMDIAPTLASLVGLIPAGGAGDAGKHDKGNQGPLGMDGHVLQSALTDASSPGRAPSGEVSSPAVGGH